MTIKQAKTNGTKSSADVRAAASRLYRFARHRERMMNFYGAWKTKERMESVSRILKRLDFFRNSYNLANVLLKLQKDAYLIAAGRSSKFYESEQQKLESIFETAKANL